jgi:hypothetical protein
MSDIGIKHKKYSNRCFAWHPRFQYERNAIHDGKGECYLQYGPPYN